jgi:hypothetical protein
LLWARRRRIFLASQAEQRQRTDNSNRFEAYGNDLADEAENVLRVVGAVGVVGAGALLG